MKNWAKKKKKTAKLPNLTTTPLFILNLTYIYNSLKSAANVALSSCREHFTWEGNSFEIYILW